MQAACSTHLALLLDAELLGHQVGNEGLEEGEVNGCSNQGGGGIYGNKLESGT